MDQDVVITYPSVSCIISRIYYEMFVTIIMNAVPLETTIRNTNFVTRRTSEMVAAVMTRKDRTKFLNVV
jgi:hypothetical protein